MKKLLLTVSVFAGLTYTANAQECATTPSDCIPPAPLDSPGLRPTSDELPCFVKGSDVNQTIDFENYTEFALGGGTPLTVEYITIDAVDLTPTASNSGICWAMGPNTPGNQIPGGAVGCLKVSGTLSTSVPAGQYRLNIALKAKPQGLPEMALSAPSSQVALYYWLRVIEPGASCPQLDTIAGKDSEFIAYSGTGINDINANVSQLSVSPNPFGATAKVSFYTEKQETYTVKMTNILGAEIFSKEVVTKNGGTNTVAIENKNYANGVYLVSLTNGKSTVTKRVVVQQ